MSFTWWALPGILTFLAAWVFAAVVMKTAPARAVNRHLSVVLVLGGLWMGGLLGFLFLLSSPRLAFATATLGAAAMAALTFQYLAFLGASLDSPLVRPFQGRVARWVLGSAAAASALLVLSRPQDFLGSPYSPEWASWNVQFQGPAAIWLLRAHAAVSFFGLVAALAAWRRTRPGSAARGRARWFAIAFGVRDAYLVLAQPLYPILRPMPFWGDFVYNPLTSVLYLFFIAALAYGVLRVQVLEIDLKLKLALQQSTVGALITGGFFLTSEILESLLPINSKLVGLGAAALIVTLLRPFQVMAERLAGRVMPTVQDTPDYLEGRKTELYRAAVEGAIQDGSISERERAILDSLAAKLGIAGERAAAVERELAPRSATAPAPAPSATPSGVPNLP